MRVPPPNSEVELAYGPTHDLSPCCLVMQNYGLLYYLPRNKLDLDIALILLTFRSIRGLFLLILDFVERF